MFTHQLCSICQLVLVLVGTSAHLRSYTLVTQVARSYALLTSYQVLFFDLDTVTLEPGYHGCIQAGNADFWASILRQFTIVLWKP